MIRTRLFSLIRAQLNNSFALSHSYFYYIRRRERSVEFACIVLSILSLVCFLSFGSYSIGSWFYKQSAAIGQGGLTLLTAFLAVQFLILLLGFGLVIGVFYYSTDLGLLIPLPLRPWEVIASKLSVILVTQYLVQSVFVIPVLLSYALRASVNPWLFWPLSAIVFLFVPVIPLVLAAIPAIGLMRLVNLSKRRDTFITIGGFALILVVLALQFVAAGWGQRGLEVDQFRTMLRRSDSLVDLVGAGFPPALWAARTLLDAGSVEGLLNLVRFAALSSVGLAFLLWLGERIFYEGAVAGFETRSQKRQAVHSGDFPLSRYRRRRPLLALARTEVRLFTRTPVYVLNGFVGFILFPGLFLVAMLTQNPEFAKIGKLLAAGKTFQAVGGLLIAGYLLALTAMSTIPFSPFSREGIRNIWIARSLPVDGETMALAKAMAALFMIFTGSLPGLVLIAVMLHVPVLYVLNGILAGLAASATLSIWGVLIDMLRPMLRWTSQAKAIKSNLNTVISILLGAVLGAVFGFAAKRALDAGFSAESVITGLTVLALILLAVSWLAVHTLAARLWDRLEV